MLTQSLLILIALLVAAGAWRLGRWHWRPRLVLPEAPVLERTGAGIRVLIDIRNQGAGKSRNCRAVLVRCEKRESIGWLRIEPHRIDSPGDPHRAGADIHPDGSARIELDRVLPDEPGTYRLEIAVLNGEERRSSYVVDTETVLPGVSH